MSTVLTVIAVVGRPARNVLQGAQDDGTANAPKALRSSGAL